MLYFGESRQVNKNHEDDLQTKSLRDLGGQVNSFEDHCFNACMYVAGQPVSQA